MASIVRVNSINARTGLSTVTLDQSGVGIKIAGVCTATSFSGSIAAANVDSGTVATARLGSGTANNTTFLRGDSSWQTVPGTTINSNTDNYLITGTGTANTLQGEDTLSYDGTSLLLNKIAGNIKVRSAAQNVYGQWYTGNAYTALGTESNDYLYFFTNGLANERLRITSAGQVLIGETSGTGMSAYDLGMKNSAAIRFRNAAGNAWINTVGLDNSNNLKLGWGGSVDEIHFGISGIGEQARFDSGGRLLIGTTASTPLYPSALQVVGSSGSTGSILIRRTDDGTPIFRTLVGQSGQNVANTSCVGNWTGAGYHTDGYDECAQITMNADGAVSNGTLPGRIVFFTHKAGTGLSEVMRLTQGGNIGVAGATGTDFSLLDGMVVNVANGSAGLLINSSSSSHNAYLGFSYGSGSSTSHADQFSAYLGRVGDNQLVFGTNNVIRGQVSPTGGLQWGLPGSSSSLPGAHGALNVRALANGNLHVRASTDLQGGTTGVGLDILNDAGNTVQDLVIRGATTYFRNASGETLRIDSTGRLGLGVAPYASSNVSLSLKDGTNFWSSSINNSYWGVNTYYNGSAWKYIANGIASTFRMENGILNIILLLVELLVILQL